MWENPGRRYECCSNDIYQADKAVMTVFFSLPALLFLAVSVVPAVSPPQYSHIFPLYSVSVRKVENYIVKVQKYSENLSQFLFLPPLREDVKFALNYIKGDSDFISKVIDWTTKGRLA